MGNGWFRFHYKWQSLLLLVRIKVNDIHLEQKQPVKIDELSYVFNLKHSKPEKQLSCFWGYLPNYLFWNTQFVFQSKGNKEHKN